MAFVGCRAYNSSDLNLTSGADTVVMLNSEYYDTNGFHSTSVNTSRLTIPAGLTGYYQIFGCAALLPQTAPYAISLFIRKNGGSIRLVQQQLHTSANASSVMSIASTARLEEGDYIELLAFQNSGATVTLASSTPVSSEFTPVFGLSLFDMP